LAELRLSVQRALLEPSDAVVGNANRQRMRILATICLPLIAFESWSMVSATASAVPIYMVSVLFWLVAYGFSRTSRTTVAGLYAALAASIVPYAGIGTEVASTTVYEEVMWLVLAVLIAGLTLPTRALVVWGIVNVAILGVLFGTNPDIPPRPALTVTAFVGLVTFLSGIWSTMRAYDDALIERHTESLTDAAALLRQEQAFTGKTLAAMGDPLLVADDQRNLLMVNRALTDLLGFDAERLVGLPAAVLFANPDTVNEIFSGMLRRKNTNGDQVEAMSVRLLTSAGASIPMSLNAAAMRTTGTQKLLGAVCVARDMRPALRLAEMEAKEAYQRDRFEELQASNRQLIQAQAQLVQAGKLAAVGQLAAAVAHEINNPLAAIQLSAKFIGDDHGTDAATQANVSAILESGKQARNIVEKLLEFGRETGVVQEPVDLLDIVQSSLALVGHKIQMGGARIDTSTMEGRFIVLGDPAQLRQVVINLLLNAGHAVDVGGKITLGMEVIDGLVHLTVQDTGHGMSETVRDRIFEPFFTTREIGEGTGLGLSVSYGIIRGHGGTIEVESREGRGSTFSILLPWRPERSKPVVLIVDDDPVVLPALATAVKRANCEVYSAQNRADAMRILARNSVDIVISDFQLGPENGVELLEAVHASYPRTMTVLISASTMPDMPPHISDFLPKPVSLRDLKFAIGKAMAARRARTNRAQYRATL